MKKLYSAVVLFFVVMMLFASCKENNSKPVQEAEERVFVVNIVNDTTKLKEYLNYHQHIWPEVEAGFKKAGYQKITLYHYEHLLVMTITVPKGAHLDQMGKLAESYNPRCAEWNKLMSQYQVGVPGTLPGQTWVETKQFYSFTDR